MAMNKKGFADIIESSISEYNNLCLQSRMISERIYSSSGEGKIEENTEYKYNKCMEKLAMSKMKRLYAILAQPARTRILSMSNKEVEEYRNDKSSELASEINRLMLSMEVSKSDSEKVSSKEKVEILIEQQNKLKAMSVDELKSYVISKLELDVLEETTFDGNEETEVLEKISKDQLILSKFGKMMEEHRMLEKEIRAIRSEQIIIYNDLISRNVKSELSIDEIFSEESLSNLQQTIASHLNIIVDLESGVKRDFGSKTRKAYYEIKSHDYKYSKGNATNPYSEEVLKMFEKMIPMRTYELARLQNEEWNRLNKKIFRTFEINEKIAVLSLEIDKTKDLIDGYIREWYKNTYYNSSILGPISSRASGKFEYSLGAKYALDEFVNYGVWPTEKEIAILKTSVKLNKIESEKCIIYAEQIKERLSRLYNSSLDEKKEKLEELEKSMTDLVGNWKNPVILSIINDIK